MSNKSEFPNAIPMKPGAGGGGCWVGVRVGRHNALGFAMYGPSYHSCAKATRPGKLTCHWHDRHEDRARRLKERVEKTSPAT